VPSEIIGEDLLASIVRGGKLYDNWFEETRVEAGVPRTSPIRPPPYPTVADRKLALLRMPRLGLAGCRRGHFRDECYTEIKGIRALASADAKRVIAVMRNEIHGYTDTILGLRDFADLAAFVTRD
jgi:hypothetical protein